MAQHARIVLVATVLWFAASVHTSAGDCSTPTSYASALTGGTAAERREQLRSLLQAEPFTSLDDAALKAGVQSVYEDTGSGTVRTLLSGTDVSAGGTGWVVLPLWASGTGQASAARADLHGARAAASALDQVAFGVCSDTSCTAYPDASGPSLKNPYNLVEPPADVRGDIARSLFYLATRYTGLELSNAPAPGSTDVGMLADLLQWHTADPVDGAETARNQRACEAQGGRNPFIDEPSLVGLLDFAVAKCEPGFASYWDAHVSSPPPDAATLRSALNAVLRADQDGVTYDEAWVSLKITDRDPSNWDNVIVIYGQASEPASSSGLTSGWNREHLWPQSYGVFADGADTSDLHALRASDWNVNSARNNLYFGDCTAPDAGCTSPAHAEAEASTAKNSVMFQPPASVRGDIARALFYMAVRYDGSAADPGTRDLELHESPDASWGYMGVLSVLQQWHTDDPVDDAERLRNGLVCGQQGNRNPFIDHPEWVSIIDWSGYVRPDAYPQDDDDGTGHELSAGDVVIVAFDSDNPDSLAFVPTVDVPEGTVIKFTDNGWDDTGFREGEGIIRYRVMSGGLPRGTVVTWSGPYTEGWEDAPGNLALSASGDQIIAFSGNFEAPVPLFGVHFTSGSWDAGATSTSESSIPPGLESGVTALALGHKDNYRYNGPADAGTRSNFLVNVCQPTNWVGSDGVATVTLPAAYSIAGDVHPTGIELDKVPELGVDTVISGTIPTPPAASVATYYRVAVFVFTDTWWMKPYDGYPWIRVQSDWTFSGTFATHANDLGAEFITVALVGGDTWPPTVLGLHYLPPELATISHATKTVARGPLVFDWGGRGKRWHVKRTAATRFGPGPNWFSDRAEDVYIDAQGALQLSITNHGTAEVPEWYSTEVILRESLGYGTYLFQVVGPLSTMDPSAVLGLFTWEDGASYADYREIDFEFARWGQASDVNLGQHVIQPYNAVGGGTMDRFPLRGTTFNDPSNPSGDDVVTCVMVWKFGSIQFLTLHGLYTLESLAHLPSSAVVREWEFTGAPNKAVPMPGNEQVHINLWQFHNHGAFDNAAFQGVRVKLPRFEYSPSTAAITHSVTEDDCRSMGKCWCSTTPATCVDSNAACSATCVSGSSECSASASVVPDMFYHVPTNSLITTVCQPGPPYNDDCSTPDVEEFGVEYWRRSGLATGTLACRTE